AAGNTCGRYCEPTQVLPQSCASSSRTHAIAAPADTVSICARGVPATCVGWPEWQKKMRAVCLACDTPPARLSHLPVEYACESRILLPHRLNSSGMGSRRGTVELRPFFDPLPPNPSCSFYCNGLSSIIFYVRRTEAFVSSVFHRSHPGGR